MDLQLFQAAMSIAACISTMLLSIRVSRVLALVNTCGVDFCNAFRVWCMDMISLPHSSSEKAQKSTTCPKTLHISPHA